MKSCDMEIVKRMPSGFRTRKFSFREAVASFRHFELFSA